MRNHALIPVIALLMLNSVTLFAEESTQEPALALTFDDPRVEWGPCPDFLPEGCEIAVLHGNPAEPNVDIYFKVPGGAVIPAHVHTSPERMVLVSGELEVSYEGQEPVVMRPGTYAYGPAGRPHEAVCAEGPSCVLFIAFVAPLDAIPMAPDESE